MFHRAIKTSIFLSALKLYGRGGAAPPPLNNPALYRFMEINCAQF
ncbi:MAG TPA: hypothetical protein VGO67_08505 [Verrucomicrobiae bacterium]|jgi:hypothetical protein